ncbi:MAG: hypothetical protein AAF423_05465 [Pseudomonadota bacterium]
MLRFLIIALMLAGAFAQHANATMADVDDILLNQLKSVYQSSVIKASGNPAKLARLKQIYETARHKADRAGGSSAPSIIHKANREMRALAK